MSILNWFTGLLSNTSARPENITDIDSHSISRVIDDSAINPASGLPMVNGECGVDIAGNTFGSNSSHDTFSSGINDSFGSGFDDSFSNRGGFNDW